MDGCKFFKILSFKCTMALFSIYKTPIQWPWSEISHVGLKVQMYHLEKNNTNDNKL